MAIKTAHRPNKKIIMNFMVLIVLSWLTLMTWVSCLWCFLGFDHALNTILNLSQKQNLTINLPLPNFKTDLGKRLPEVLIYKIKQISLLMKLTTQIVLTKLIILILAIPLFLLTMTVGLIDGLSQRAIRTASLGRESSYVFHQLNRYLKRGIFLLLAFWLALPISITPAFVFIPVSLLLSIMVSITASRFKKYL